MTNVLTNSQTTFSFPWTSTAAVAALILLAGCASTAQPVTYQKSTPTAAQAQRVALHTQECRRLAQDNVGVNANHAQSGKPAAQSAAKLGVVAFASTAVGSLVNASKDAWQRARAAGAAGVVGVATKAVLDWNAPDEVYQTYFERCMEERGHEVLGWR